MKLVPDLMVKEPGNNTTPLLLQKLNQGGQSLLLHNFCNVDYQCWHLHHKDSLMNLSENTLLIKSTAVFKKGSINLKSHEVKNEFPVYMSGTGS